VWAIGCFSKHDGVAAGMGKGVGRGKREVLFQNKKLEERR
jgi:hypothetical protein